MDHRVLTVFLSLCSSGIFVENSNSSTDSDDVRLVGGASRCDGVLQLKDLDQWKDVWMSEWDLNSGASFCRRLDCGSVISVEVRRVSDRFVWSMSSSCVQSTSSLRECVDSYDSPWSFLSALTCSDSVRLLQGPRLCSGSLEVHWDKSWTSVCEEDFDLQDAEVVCRELGCGTPSLLQGALYGEGRAPLGQTFQCEGHESALMNCTRSSSGNTCSSGKAVDLTCSDSDVRLEGGASRCDGVLQLKYMDQWRDVGMIRHDWDLKRGASVCRQLDCGSVISVEERSVSDRSVWSMSPFCVPSTSSLRECVNPYDLGSFFLSVITCSDSVRLLQGPRLCSGSLEVRWDQSWTSVCEEDFDLQDAEVVCRELGCGAPSLLQGALYGEGRAPLGQTFQCEGHESALMNCTRSSSENTCSSGKAVDLTCSDPDDVGLVGGASRCDGALQLKHLDQWRDVRMSRYDMKTGASICRQMDCGSVISFEERSASNNSVWSMSSSCVQSTSSLRECVSSYDSFWDSLSVLTCSGNTTLMTSVASL